MAQQCTERDRTRSAGSRGDGEAHPQELEEDADMRSRVALFKDAQLAAGRAARPPPSVAATDDDDGDFPEVRSRLQANECRRIVGGYEYAHDELAVPSRSESMLAIPGKTRSA